MRAVFSLLAVALVGCTREPPSKPVEAPPPPPVPVEKRCSAELPALIHELEKLPTDRRAGPALDALGTGCADVLGELAPVARSAAKLDRDERSRVLGKAAATGACTAEDLIAPASSIAERCTSPGVADVSPGVIKNIQAGTWSYLVALRTRLDDADAADERVHRLFQHLLLALALEGEASR